MKRILTALALSAVLASPAWSEPITIRCTDLDPSSNPMELSWTYVLDLDKKIAEVEVSPGEFITEILEVYPKYITANINQPDIDFFGIWVLDRVSLQMLTLIIDEFSWPNPDGSVSEPQSYRAQCIRGI